MANEKLPRPARALTRTGAPASATDARLLADGLHSAAIHLLRRLRREDLAMGLSAARASVLSVLVFGGERSVGELAEAEQVSVPTMSRMLAGMERAGLVRRRRDPADARAVRIRPTAAGRRLLQAGRERRLDRLEALLEGMAAADRAVLARAITLLRGVLDGPDAGGAGATTVPATDPGGARSGIRTRR